MTLNGDELERMPDKLGVSVLAEEVIEVSVEVINEGEAKRVSVML